MLAGKAPVKTVDAHEPCLLALQKLLAVGVAGAAVVEGGTAGAIIANLSASDLRCAPGRAVAESQPTHEAVEFSDLLQSRMQRTDADRL